MLFRTLIKTKTINIKRSEGDSKDFDLMVLEQKPISIGSIDRFVRNTLWFQKKVGISADRFSIGLQSYIVLQELDGSVGNVVVHATMDIDYGRGKTANELLTRGKVPISEA